MGASDMSGRIVSLVALLVPILFSGAASAADWRVVRLNQPAQMSVDGERFTFLRMGQVLPSAVTLRTGRYGRIMLRRGRETLVLRPKSKLRLSREGGYSTVIRQRWGGMEMKVGRRARPHVYVETRHLAAVVKGTRFKTKSSFMGSSFSVSSGVVQVWSKRSGDAHELGAGRAAGTGMFGLGGLSVSASRSEPAAMDDGFDEGSPTVIRGAHGFSRSVSNNTPDPVDRMPSPQQPSSPSGDDAGPSEDGTPDNGSDDDGAEDDGAEGDASDDDADDDNTGGGFPGGGATGGVFPGGGATGGGFPGGGGDDDGDDDDQGDDD